MGCRGCGKKNLAAIARASAETTLTGRQAVPKKEKRPQYLETACAGCGAIIRQNWNQLNRENKPRKLFCSKTCEGTKRHRQKAPGSPAHRVEAERGGKGE